jgi:hypothetical protein
VKTEPAAPADANDKRPLIERDPEVRIAIDTLKTQLPQRDKQVAQANL